MNPHPHIHHIRHALAPFRPYLTTGALTQPGPGLLLALWVLLLWLGVM